MRRSCAMRACLSGLLFGLAGCGGTDDGAAQLSGVEDVEQELVVCGRGPMVVGIDVSEWQGNVDWSAVASAGMGFAIARVSDGFHRDPYFAQNWAAIPSVGLVRGAYQYFRPDADPVAQADIVVEMVGVLGPGDLPVTIDVEAPNPGVGWDVYNARIHAWVDRVTAGTGRAPMVYTGRYYWADHVGTSDFAGLPLWHAQYTSASCPNIADAWGNWTFWQWTSEGSVPGVAGNVDMNAFNGTLQELQALAVSNRRPVGYLDAAHCDVVAGWAQDPDVPDQPIGVHIYFGGAAGEPGAMGYSLVARNHREDLCAAIGSCAHGFTLHTPRAFLDGNPRPVFAYGIDSAGGTNPLLGAAPQTLQCPPPVPPYPPDVGVRRHVPGPEIMSAWQFDWNDIAPLAPEVLDAFPDGAAVGPAPALIQAAGDPAVYLVDGETLRHVSSPAAMDSWRFSWGAIQQVPAEEVSPRLHGAPLGGDPFLARAPGRPEVYLIDAPPPLWALPVTVSMPSALHAGEVAQAELVLRNRGAVAWNAGEVSLVTTAHPNGSPLCDPSWPDCSRPATASSSIAPGSTGTFRFAVRAPDGAEGTVVRECFSLVLGGHAFFAPGQGGPSRTSLCTDVAVTAAQADGGEPGQPDGGMRDGGESGDAPPSPDAAMPDAGPALDGDASADAGVDETVAPDDGGWTDGSAACSCALPRSSSPLRVWLGLLAAFAVRRRSRGHCAKQL